MRKGKPKKHTATTLLRISTGLLKQVRAEAKRRGMTMRAFGDNACRAYLSQPGA
jgi:hypothetical protein